MNHGFRFAATTAEAGRLIHRPRLTSTLAGRFDHRLTLVVGAAGYGKTASLSLAVENNRLDPIGRDVWLSAVPNDAEADHLAAGIARAMQIEPAGRAHTTIERILDSFWSDSPTDVALVVDDAHLLTSDEARDVLVRLLDDLPTNGHLVLASRQPLGLPVGRLRAHGQLLEIGPTDLELDAAEVEELVAKRRSSASGTGSATTSGPTGDLPRHAATADLALAAGRSASVEFLWEEILDDLEPDRLRDLQRAAVVESLDDHLVRELTDGRFDLETLLDGIPLTVQIDRSIRLHALLREALLDRVSEADERKALAVAGGVERERRRWSEAVQLFEAADDTASAIDTIRGFCLASTVHRTIEDSIVLLDVVNRLRPDSGLAGAVELSHIWLGISRQDRTREQVDHLAERTIERLREEGDLDLEVMQRHLRLQDAVFSAQPIDRRHLDRLAELADHHPLSRYLHAFNESQRLAEAGDVDGALAMVEVVQEARFDTANLVPERFADLGRYEKVMATTAPADVRDDAPMTAYAMWLRGEADPALAFLVVDAQMPEIIRRGFDIVTLSTLGVGTAIAAAAGRTESMRRWTEHANSFLEPGVVPTAELFAHMATAITAAQRGDEEAAAAALDPERTGIGFDGWPPRATLMSVPLVYLVRPDARAMFDRHRYGPAATVALEAARALVALRERVDPGPAAHLPWSSPDLLRANVLPVHLAELGAAACAAGSAQAGDVVRSLPRRGEILPLARARLAERLRSSVDQFADHDVVTLPFALHTNVLGDVELFRDGVRVDDERWVRRAKVRELWCYLVCRGGGTRDEIVRDLWPDSSEDPVAEEKAYANLRSTLSMLGKIIEPDRTAQGTAFIHADTHRIDLVAFTSDFEQIQDASAAALAADASQAPLESLRRHGHVVDLYRGALAESLDAGWIVLERIRLRTLALSSLCRVAELTLARGEPEAAVDLARRALRHDPLHERAGRTFVSALAASGDRGAALAAAEDLERRWTAEDWTLETATTRAFERLRAGSR